MQEPQMINNTNSVNGGAMSRTNRTAAIPRDRRQFVGGSDARIIMGKDEKALLRLWKEKRGEAAPTDLSGVLIVQLGLVTEDLNRRWYELNSGHRIGDIQRHAIHCGFRGLRPWIPIERDHAVRSKAATCSDEGGRVSLPAFGVGSDFLGCVKFGALRSDLSHAVSIECEAVSVVDEPVEDGIGDGRIGHDVVPIFDRHLAGDDGRSALVAIVDDFEEIATLLAGERREAPIVEDEQIDPR